MNTFTPGTAPHTIVQYLSKRKTPATAVQISNATGIALKTVQNRLCPSDELSFVKAKHVGPGRTLAYSL